MRHAAILLALATASPALGDDALTFLGTLNGRDIVVELTDGVSGSVVGRYAFRDTGGDIPLLAVSNADGTMTLHEEAVCDETTCMTDDEGKAVNPPLAAVWELTYDAEEYVATGTRSTLEGKPKVAAVELYVEARRTLDATEEISPFGLHDRSAMLGFDDAQPLDWSAAPYEMALLDTELATGPEDHVGKTSFHDVTDPRTKFAFPRVIGFDDGSSLDAVNAILAERHGRMNLSAFDCLAFQYSTYGKGEFMSSMGGTLGDFDSETVELSYASPRVVSWVQSGSLWCTGAHPYNHVDSYTYDVATRQPLDLARIFAAWVPREWGAALDDVAELAEVAKNPDGFYWGPRADLVAYVRDNVPADVFDEELEGECLTDEALAEKLDIRFAEEDSVVFTLSGFPHVISVCNGDLFSVRLDELKPFLGKGASAYFPGV
ncbi:MAG: hypothetical protein EOP20_05485 [Hyphomicrobiales bacterium]|nr:MAG: hypothetical protein EOP20_05485 [Hyphomicrobiales bacterium]